MIVQSPDPDAGTEGARFVTKNVEHGVLVGQLADCFGNSEFNAPEPRAEILYLAVHHDHGWQAIDDDPPVNPGDGLPYNLVKTPFEFILKTSTGSPDFNERHSAFCGLLSSMHTYGLYNGRYGLSDAVTMDAAPQEIKTDIDAMLKQEQLRQQRLRSALSESALSDEAIIFNAYKLLQFFDACALYFNRNPPGRRGTSYFHHVARAVDEDVTVYVTEAEPDVYAFNPFPFRESGLQVFCEGRYLRPDSGIKNGAKLMQSAPRERQTMTLVRG
ncbi:MAG: DUF3891 family protein [Gammaproteobacteria bacterium]